MNREPCGFLLPLLFAGLVSVSDGESPAVTRAERDPPTPAHTTIQPRPHTPPRGTTIPGPTSGRHGSLHHSFQLHSGHSAVRRIPNPKAQRHTHLATGTGHPAPARLPASTGITSCNEKPRDCDRSTWSTLQFGNMWLAIQLSQTSLVSSDLDFQLPSLTPTPLPSCKSWLPNRKTARKQLPSAKEAHWLKRVLRVGLLGALSS